MPMPVTENQLKDELQGQYGFTGPDSQTIIDWLRGSGIIRFHGPMIDIPNPSTQDARLVIALINGAQGRARAFGKERIQEYLKWVLQSPMPHST